MESIAMQFVNQYSTNFNQSREDRIAEVVESVIRKNTIPSNGSNLMNSATNNAFSQPTTSQDNGQNDTTMSDASPRKRRSWYYKFKPEYAHRYVGIQKSDKGDDYFYCITCGIDLALGKKGHRAIERHIVSIRHISVKDKPENAHLLSQIIQTENYNQVNYPTNGHISTPAAKTPKPKKPKKPKISVTTLQTPMNHPNTSLSSIGLDFSLSGQSTDDSTVKKKAHAYSNEFKLEVIAYCKATSNHEASRKYDIDRKTIRRWRLAEEGFKNGASNPNVDLSKVLPEVVNLDLALEAKLVEWIQQELVSNKRVTGDTIQKQAQEIHDRYHKCPRKPCFKASDAFLQNFSIKHNIAYRPITNQNTQPAPTMPVSNIGAAPQYNQVNSYAYSYETVRDRDVASKNDILKDLVDSALYGLEKNI